MNPFRAEDSCLTKDAETLKMAGNSGTGAGRRELPISFPVCICWIYSLGGVFGSMVNRAISPPVDKVYIIQMT
jgi:hypothetical protein